ncbi:MAG TPA: hypothetical protein VHE57_13120 [Mycobacteriales bacterium]|nr:hypothetical protein [Mycobacteriales bacterium]
MRRLIVAGVIAVAGSSTVATAAAVAPTAHTAPGIAPTSGQDHVGPDKAAWYDAGRATPAAPPVPMPGVGPKDLVVEGLTINTSLLPISLPIPPIRQVTALAALSFTLPDGATPASLTLKLDGLNTTVIDKHLPSGVTPIACLATSTFKSGAQQALSAAPKYDCSKRSTVGQLSSTGKAVTFPGISRLMTGDTLSVVILPGSLGIERLVFRPPTNRTLSLITFASPEPIDTPSATPTSPPPPDVTAPAAGGSPRVPPIPPAPAGTGPQPSATAPVIAPTPQVTAVALSEPDDTRDRTAAVGLLVALAVAGMWLTATDHRRAKPQEMGIGRFRSLRSGPPPTI